MLYKLFAPPQDSLDRWRSGMCKRKHWRKTFQWISLNRAHAELIAWEQEINKGFRELCHPHINLRLGRFVSCSDNEHYPPIVLAAHDVGHETTCWPGGTTYVDWRIPDAEGRPRYAHTFLTPCTPFQCSRPRTYAAGEITPGLLQRARRSQCDFSQCQATCATDEQVDAALQSASSGFVHALHLHECCQQLTRYEPLGNRCPLFMRKFKAGAEDRLQQVLAPMIFQQAPAPATGPRLPWARRH